MPDILAIAEAGMRASMEQLNAISNNMANVNTQGYRREIHLNRPFQNYITVAEQQSRAVASSARDFTPGTFRQTGSPLHMAIEGGGFFQLQSPQGIFLTRNGQFQINAEGQLVSLEGWPVVMNGAITLQSENFKLSSDGTIGVGDQQSQLSIVNADANSLEIVGPGLYKVSGGLSPLPQGAHVRQGYLENSNVNSLQEMIKLMTVARHIEASQQMIRAYGDAMDTAISTLGEF
jgi:flagellar basal-body rod protein FlgF